MARQLLSGSTRALRLFSASLVPLSILVNTSAQSAARDRQSSTYQIGSPPGLAQLRSVKWIAKRTPDGPLIAPKLTCWPIRSW